MKRRTFPERGQVLIVFAFAAIGLFAIVGLAIDGTKKFSDQRHAQNAADTAALAGALSLVNGNTSTWKLDAIKRAEDNGYIHDLMRSTVQVHLCNEADVDCGPSYTGNGKYVQVVIDSYVDTTFSRVIGIDRLHNHVEAVTLWALREPVYKGDSIVALNPNPSCPGSFLVGGSGEINLTGGGMYINSANEDCVWEQQGCNVTVNVTGTSADGDPANITSAGGSIDIDGSCAEQINADTSTSGGAYDFPPEMPDEPDECISPNGTWSSNSVTEITTLNPGRYNEFPPKSGGGVTVYDHVVMNPGIYCVNDLVKLSDRHLHLTGSDVTIFIRAGYGFSIEGGEINLSATTKDSTYTGDFAPYIGYVIIVDSNFAGSPVNCKIDGNAENSFSGTIYAPYCNLTINGGSEDTSYNAQIIAYEVKLNGNNTINFTYSPDVNRYSEPKVGMMR